MDEAPYSSPYRINERELRAKAAGFTGRAWDDFQMTLAEAEAVEVKYGAGRKKEIVSLWWLAQNDPAFLDLLMDRTKPGTREFFALAVVCEKYEGNIMAALHGTWKPPLEDLEPSKPKRVRLRVRLEEQ